jgi:SHS family lactate transporter-like MFS transporter
MRAVISTSGTFIAYLSIFSVYPDFAEYFVLFPAYYVGLLTAIADGIQGTSYVVFGKLSYRLNVYYM